MSVTQKNVPSAVVIYYCAWYVFLRDRRYLMFITFNKISSILSWKAIKYDFGTFNISVFEKLEEPCSFRVTNVPFWIFCHLRHLRSIVLIIVDSEKPWISKHSVERKIPAKVTWVKKHRTLTRGDSYSNTVFSKIVSAKNILFWILPYVLWPLVTVHTGAETIQGRKLFKGGNYSRKYGICTRDLGYLGQQVFSLFQLEKKTKFYKMFTICGLHSYIFLEKNICNILFNYSMLLRREHKKGCNLLNC